MGLHYKTNAQENIKLLLGTKVAEDGSVTLVDKEIEGLKNFNPKATKDDKKSQLVLTDVDVSPNGEFKGHAAAFNNFDRANEAIQPTAFDKYLGSFLEDGFIAYGHDDKGLPLATVRECYPDEYGLFVHGEFHSTNYAKDAKMVIYERLTRGKSVKMSIGYRVLDSEMSSKGRLLKELYLYECSIVNIPCNPMAMVSSVKSLLDTMDEESQELFEGQLAGLKMVDEFNALTDSIQKHLLRRGEINELRLKEGRRLSVQSNRKLLDLRTLIDNLIKINSSQEDHIKNIEETVEQLQTVEPTSLIEQLTQTENVEVSETNNNNTDNTGNNDVIECQKAMVSMYFETLNQIYSEVL